MSNSDATAPMTGPAAGAPDKAAPIFLRAADVKAKVREALLHGALQAQTKRGDTPRYSGPCAIGVCVSLEARKRFDAPEADTFGYSVYGLISAGLVETDDKLFLEDLQNAHDKWFAGNDDGEELRRLLGIDGAA